MKSPGHGRSQSAVGLGCVMHARPALGRPLFWRPVLYEVGDSRNVQPSLTKGQKVGSCESASHRHHQEMAYLWWECPAPRLVIPNIGETQPQPSPSSTTVLSPFVGG